MITGIDLEKYKTEGFEIFYFDEDKFMGDPENFEAIVNFIIKNYDGFVIETLTAADVDVRQIKIGDEVVIFKDSGDYVYMVNQTVETGGIVKEIYADLASRIDVAPSWHPLPV